MKDSVAVRVVVWFTLNPEIEMTIKELSMKFNKPEASMRVSIRLLASRGFVCVRTVDEDTATGRRNRLHVSIGPELQKEIDR